MNIFHTLKNDVVTILNGLVHSGFLPQGLSFDAVTAEPPREAAHGDIATNAGLVLAKAAGKNPREIAEKLAEGLRQLPYVTEVGIAGPGFINLRLTQDFWQCIVKDILTEGVGYGDSDMGKNLPMNVEYVSANPTGPMHIGHARGAVFGDALALLLIKAGYNVTKEYYINDAGAQVDVLAKSAFLRYREALGQDIGAIPDGLYPGEYLKGAGEALKHQYGDALLDMSEAEWLPLVRQSAIESMLALIKQDLADLGVVHDVFTSEAGLHKRGLVDEALTFLENKGLIYKGILEAPKGKTPEDWEPREQTLFRATQFGDDVDRALKKSDGSWTYFASDIAYHLDKIRRGFNHMVLELGKDHGGYLKRMKAAVAGLSDNKAEIAIKFHDLVNFMDNGQPVKMSKRKGTFTTVRDVLDEVDKDIIRFIMLSRKNDMVLDFDFAQVKEQSKDNPVFYVQYAHARARSVLRNAGVADAAIDAIDDKALALLQNPAEIDVIKTLAQWPRLVESAAATFEPHRIVYYAQEVAAAFHSLWNKGKEHDNLRFIIEGNAELTLARLALVKALSLVIKSALCVIGVDAVEEM